MIGTLAKLKEICEWWKERYDNLHSFVESLSNVDPDCLTQTVKREFTFEISRLTIDVYTNELIGPHTGNFTLKCCRLSENTSVR